MSFGDRTPRLLPDTEPLIGTTGAAEALIDEVVAALDALVAVIREETRLIRAGMLFAAAELEPEKSRTTAAYLRLRTRVKSNSVALGRFCGERIEDLRRRHADFTVVLRENLTVLAIAREVSEDLVRTVAESVGRRAAPATYGRDAGAAMDRLGGARGIAVDRRL